MTLTLTKAGILVEDGAIDGHPDYWTVFIPSGKGWRKAHDDARKRGREFRIYFGKGVDYLVPKRVACREWEKWEPTPNSEDAEVR